MRHAVEFDAVFKRGKRLPHLCFVTCHLKTDRSYPRLGMVISKKNCQRAVDRNHIKRLVREQFRAQQHFLLGMDVVVLLKSPVGKLSDKEQCECVEKLFSQLIAHCSGSS
ncbi:MAG: ribonuclease P protein component [Gammaproteobacteria bacterium RIFCSPHIGHO2_12_FULL_38_11]|nr:MAG: ribonuclease P protein component [Gammaproteobacteria bacterium RIFCSPHIGHO2_12_FULL_38_11]